MQYASRTERYPLAGCQPLAVVLNRTYDDPGPVVFEHVCKLGCEAL